MKAITRFASLFIVSAILFSCSSCSTFYEIVKASFVASEKSFRDLSSADFEDNTGYYDGRIGDTMHTYFFDFTVMSAKFVDEYAEYSPASGNRLIQSVIKVKNTCGNVLPMYNTDFQIQWGDEGFGYGITDIKDSHILLEKNEIKRGDTITYTVVYEVPAGNTEFSISYLETFSDNSEGDVFFIFFEL